MQDESFADECRRRFMDATDAMHLALFHKDKRIFRNEAEQALDAYNDWLEVQSL